MRHSTELSEHVGSVISAMVGQDDYPCLGAKSVFRRDAVTVRAYDTLGTAPTASLLLSDLTAFATDGIPARGFASFLAAFRTPVITQEAQFERLLWRQLDLLAAADPVPWNHEVSADPADPHFAFSIAGTAFFVVGMHPAASRLARRTDFPVLVFNPHQQFEELRRAGRYDRMRDTIRRRDRAWQGSVNPMVTDHGVESEARQYAGRCVPAQWRAPFPDPTRSTTRP